MSISEYITVTCCRMYIICYRQGDGVVHRALVDRQLTRPRAPEVVGVVLYSSVTRDPSRSIVSVPSLRGFRVSCTMTQREQGRSPSKASTSCLRALSLKRTVSQGSLSVSVPSESDESGFSGRCGCSARHSSSSPARD